MINTQRLKDRASERGLIDWITRPKPPKPPATVGPLSRSYLYLPAGDAAFRAPAAYHATDLIMAVGSNLMWEPGTEAELRAALQKCMAAAAGLPLHAFYWCFAGDGKTLNPWNASAAQWETFLARVRIVTAAGAAGHMMDCEDEGRIAKRDPKTGAMLVEWWPRRSNLATRAGQWRAAVGTADPGIYAIHWMQLNLTGYNGNLTPNKVAADGWFDFCKALPAGYPLYLGDTYTDDSQAAINGTEADAIGSGPQQCGAPKVVPGTWIEAAEVNDTNRRLGLIAAAQAEAVPWWAYTDPGTLPQDLVYRDLSAKLAAAHG